MTRKECIKWLKSLKTEIGKPEHQELWHYAEAIDKVMESLSADKVEVVRCKECKWNTHYPFCDIDRNDDFFCADGEK